MTLREEIDAYLTDCLMWAVRYENKNLAETLQIIRYEVRHIHTEHGYGPLGWDRVQA